MGKGATTASTNAAVTLESREPALSWIQSRALEVSRAGGLTDPRDINPRQLLKNRDLVLRTLRLRQILHQLQGVLKNVCG